MLASLLLACMQKNPGVNYNFLVHTSVSLKCTPILGNIWHIVSKNAYIKGNNMLLKLSYTLHEYDNT